MRERYKIDIKHQLKSYKNGFMMITYLFFGVLAIYLFGYSDEFISIFLFTLIAHGIYSLPAFIIHLTYYLDNFRLIVEIDESRDEIIFNKRDKNYRYKISELIKVERNIQKDFKFPKWQQNWIPIPWRYYGFIRIETPDQNTFNITSLMIDIVNTPINSRTTRYRILPFLEESLKEKIKKEQKTTDLIDRRIQYFKGKFENYSTQQLDEILNSGDFQEEAMIAAKELKKIK
jgi:hypothetical protein